ncbi:MAG: thioredoxin family protein [Flavobacteriaceae bacterium]|nr:thioredoxin family protein [Flavobacteriaceae bacterium]
MFTVLGSLDEIEELKQTEKGFVLYISDGTCNVGVNILPKLEKILAENFPQLKIFQVYTSLTPEIAAQLSIFVIPTVLVYFDGKMSIQKSRSFSIEELQHEIDRYYQLLY